MQRIMGIVAFGLFFLGDLNDWKLDRKGLRLCFPLGLVLLTAATAWEMVASHRGFSGIAVPPAAVFLVLELYTLFFALPAQSAYVSQVTGRPACTTGVYALCRHPGVLWFWGLYGVLWLGGGLGGISALCYCLLNLLLILFEDRWVFPATLDHYDAYQQRTPFLIPSRDSVRSFLRSGRNAGPSGIRRGRRNHEI